MVSRQMCGETAHELKLYDIDRRGVEISVFKDDGGFRVE